MGSDELVERNRRTLTDTQRLIWRDDVEGICPSPDMCFEYGGHVRCGPCAIKQSLAQGVEPDMSLPNLPEVSRLRREIEALTAQLAEARESERAAVVAYFRKAAEAVRLDADEGLWEGIEDEVQDSIDCFNGYANSIETGEHLT